MASFNTSPPDFLAECIKQLRSFEIPINEYDGGIDLQRSLINSSDLTKARSFFNLAYAVVKKSKIP